MRDGRDKEGGGKPFVQELPCVFLRVYENEG